MELVHYTTVKEAALTFSAIASLGVFILTQTYDIVAVSMAWSFIIFGLRYAYRFIRMMKKMKENEIFLLTM